MSIKFYQLLFSVGLLVFSLVSLANVREQQREDFLQAESRIFAGTSGDFSVISQGLSDYPLYSYLEYQWLSRHLDKKAQIKAFLYRHKAARYSRKLRADWLTYLYKHKQWQDFY